MNALLAPAHEMHDLKTVAIMESGFRPFLAVNNFAIQLDRYSICLHSELIDQRRQSQTAVKAALFPVDS
jgi:hypothetical protein